METMKMDPKTMSPKEVDTALASIYGKIDPIAFELGRLADSFADATRRGLANRLRSIESRQAELRPRLLALEAEAAPLDAEYARRRWTRYFLVLNGNGHVHRERTCSTCFPTTRYGWLPALSGCDEAAMVAEYGEQACTVCFPAAPSLYQKLLAAGLKPRTTVEREAVAAKRTAEKAERAAKKAEKAITNPDGTPLKLAGRFGDRIETLVTAKLRLTDCVEWARYPGGNEDVKAEYRENIERLVAAIAAKTGVDAATVRADAEKRAAKRG